MRYMFRLSVGLIGLFVSCLVQTLGLPSVRAQAAPSIDAVDNIVPEDFIYQDSQLAARAVMISNKLTRNRSLPSGMGLSHTPMLLPGVPGVSQAPCANFCGPAAASSVLLFRGVRLPLNKIAVEVSSPGLPLISCNNGLGTCLVPMVNFLNRALPGLPWPGFYQPHHLTHSSVRDAARELDMIVTTDVGSYQMPVITLLSPSGLKLVGRSGEIPRRQQATKACLPGWCGRTSIGHYITINGRELRTSGRDSHVVIYYRDSAMHANLQHTAEIWEVASTILAKNGTGSCSGNKLYNVIW